MRATSIVLLSFVVACTSVTVNETGSTGGQGGTKIDSGTGSTFPGGTRGTQTDASSGGAAGSPSGGSAGTPSGGSAGTPSGGTAGAASGGSAGAASGGSAGTPSGGGGTAGCGSCGIDEHCISGTCEQVVKQSCGTTCPSGFPISIKTVADSDNCGDGCGGATGPGIVCAANGIVATASNISGCEPGAHYALGLQECPAEIWYICINDG